MTTRKRRRSSAPSSSSSSSSFRLRSLVSSFYPPSRVPDEGALSRPVLSQHDENFAVAKVPSLHPQTEAAELLRHRGILVKVKTLETNDRESRETERRQDDHARQKRKKRKRRE